MPIFVTGATGVVGRRVVPLLLSRGHSVTAMAHRLPTERQRTGATIVAVDLFDVKALERAVAGHDAIINLATHMPSPVWRTLFRGAWRLNDRIRREGSANVVDAAAAVVACLNVPAGAYTVVDDEPVRRDVYFGSLAERPGVKRPRFLPAWTTPLFGAVGEAMARSLRLSNRKPLTATDWAPMLPSVRDGWPATLERMKDI